MAVDDEYGGGWLVNMIGPCRGPSGLVAHIDRQGWILRVKPYCNGQFPDRETAVEAVMQRLIDDPVRPGLGLIAGVEENDDDE
jgi:hypothetical protein